MLCALTKGPSDYKIATWLRGSETDAAVRSDRLISVVSSQLCVGQEAVNVCPNNQPMDALSSAAKATE